MANADPSRLQLYLITDYKKGEESILPSGAIRYVFCLQKDAEVAHVQKYGYGLVLISHFLPNQANPLIGRRREAVYQGTAAWSDVEDENSELRKTIQGTSDEQLKIKADWAKAWDEMVREEKEKRRPGEISDEQLRKWISEQCRDLWFERTLAQLAGDKVEILKKKKILI